MSKSTFEIMLTEKTGSKLLRILDQFITDERMRELGGEVQADYETLSFAKHLKATLKEELEP